jgi:DNA polymerase (family 10)
MNNVEIGEIFRNIADLLEIKGENPFKVRAYRRVVRSIEELTVPIEELALQDRLDQIPGAGDAIKKKLIELVNTGRLDYYEKLKIEVPEGVIELLAVPGIGPKTAAMLVKDAGIASEAELKIALESGRELAHIGRRTREKILQGIQSNRRSGNINVNA